MTTKIWEVSFHKINNISIWCNINVVATDIQDAINKAILKDKILRMEHINSVKIVAEAK